MNHRHRGKGLPTLLFVVLPLMFLALLLTSYFLLNNCLTSTPTYIELADADVLGVASFDMTAASTEIQDNQTVNYTAKITADNQPVGVLTSTIVFNLLGEGRIGENVQGPGACVRVSELRATCTGINLLPQETLSWTVPVTAKDTCSQSASPTLRLTATHSTIGVLPEVSEDIAIVTCVSDNPPTDGETPTTPGENNDGGNNNGNGGTSEPTSGNLGDGSGLSAEDLVAYLNKHNNEIKECFGTKLLAVGIGLFVLYALCLLVYFNRSDRKESKRD